jgi:ATP-dependent Clp protease protease subunit
VSHQSEMEDESAKLARSRTILLGSPIDDRVATEVIAKMLFLKNMDLQAPIQLVINSPGGSAVAGMAILDTMDKLDLPIRTHCLQFCGGSAATLLAHGTVGMRSASPDSGISLCRIYGGNSQEPANQINFERLVKAVISIMIKDTGQTQSQLECDMAAERYFTAREATAYGLIDRVLTPTVSAM